MVPWNSASGGFAYNWQSKWVGIIAIKTGKTQIHFLSDVLVTVVPLDLKVPIVKQQRAFVKELYLGYFLSYKVFVNPAPGRKRH